MSKMSGPRERPHPGPTTYVKVALVLAALTAIEVAAFYVPAPQGVRVAFFLLFTAVEFSIVALFYMHLKFDSRLLAGLLLGGLLVATAIIVALLGLYGVIGGGGPAPVSASPTPTAEAPQATVSASLGQRVFAAKGCVACHTVTGVAGATGQVGPALDGVATRAGGRRPPLSAEQYLREAIETPTAYVVEGFPAVMPSIQAGMADAELQSLIAFLLTLE